MLPFLQTTSAETFSSSYRTNDIHSVNYEPWPYSQDLPPCTTVAGHPITPACDLAYDSPTQCLDDTIDVTQSPLGSPAALGEQMALSPDPDTPPAVAVRRTAGRKPRRPFPVIVPNLTKKARGRQVPTKDMLLQAGSGRTFACPVESCRKVFTRSEHLKRHTRSIHTNEKRKWHLCFPGGITYMATRIFHTAQLSDARSRTVAGSSHAMTTCCSTSRTTGIHHSSTQTVAL